MGLGAFLVMLGGLSTFGYAPVALVSWYLLPRIVLSFATFGGICCLKATLLGSMGGSALVPIALFVEALSMLCYLAAVAYYLGKLERAPLFCVKRGLVAARLPFLEKNMALFIQCL